MNQDYEESWKELSYELHLPPEELRDILLANNCLRPEHEHK